MPSPKPLHSFAAGSLIKLETKLGNSARQSLKGLPNAPFNIGEVTEEFFNLSARVFSAPPLPPLPSADNSTHGP